MLIHLYPEITSDRKCFLAKVFNTNYSLSWYSNDLKKLFLVFFYVCFLFLVILWPFQFEYFGCPAFFEYFCNCWQTFYDSSFLLLCDIPSIHRLFLLELTSRYLNFSVFTFSAFIELISFSTFENRKFFNIEWLTFISCTSSCTHFWFDNK